MNSTPFWHRLQTKIILTMLAGFLLIAMIFITLQAGLDRRQSEVFRKLAGELVRTLVERDHDALANELFARQDDAVCQRLAQMLQVEGMLSIILYDAEGRVIQQLNSQAPVDLTAQQCVAITAKPDVFTEADGQSLVYSAPIALIGERLGFIRLRYGLDAALRGQVLTRTMLVIQLAALLTVLLLAALVFLNRSIIAPVHMLQHAIQRLADGDHSVAVPISSADELGKLSQDFNRMAVEREQAEANLRSREEQWRVTLDSLGDAVFALDHAHRILRLNHSARVLIGCAPEIAQGQRITAVATLLCHGGIQTWDDAELDQDGGDGHCLLEYCDPGGDLRRLAATWAPLHLGHETGTVFVLRDETERHHLQDQLRHAEKMRALGQLAGGVAHDFNNVLQIIAGRSELLALRHRGDAALEAGLTEILHASERASDLVAKLLSFARKGSLEVRPTDLHQVICDTVAMLRPALDRRIAIVTALDATVGMVMGNASQLQNVLLNLGVNARDAMPGGGTLRLTTVNRELNDEDVRRLGGRLLPGTYVEVQVSDTGTGIAPDIIDRIFEPFFTTKAVGDGTGLGLAAVFGTIEAHRGMVDVANGPTGGASFRLLIPASNAAGAHTTMRLARPATGQGDVLLIEDEPLLRLLGQEMLLELGYTPLIAEHGIAGVDCFRERHDTLVAVISDLNMPGMSGSECIRTMHQIDATVPLLLASGHFDEAELASLRINGLTGVLHKPYALHDMASGLRTAIATTAARG